MGIVIGNSCSSKCILVLRYSKLLEKEIEIENATVDLEIESNQDLGVSYDSLIICSDTVFRDTNMQCHHYRCDTWGLPRTVQNKNLHSNVSAHKSLKYRKRQHWQPSECMAYRRMKKKQEPNFWERGEIEGLAGYT